MPWSTRVTKGPDCRDSPTNLNRQKEGKPIDHLRYHHVRWDESDPQFLARIGSNWAEESAGFDVHSSRWPRSAKPIDTFEPAIERRSTAQKVLEIRRRIRRISGRDLEGHWAAMMSDLLGRRLSHYQSRIPERCRSPTQYGTGLGSREFRRVRHRNKSCRSVLKRSSPISSEIGRAG